MMEEDRLKRLDTLGKTADTREYYDAWAETYDHELGTGGYAAPQRCARALAGLAPDRAAPLLDIGCGTGQSGAAFRAEGFTVIDGVDFSERMIAKAREKGIYRALGVADLSSGWPFPPGAYPMVAAVGAWSPGHLPADLIDRVVAALPPGGLFVFSFSDRARGDPDYRGRLNECLDAGPVEYLFREGGAYLPGEGMQADVLVLRRR